MSAGGPVDPTMPLPEGERRGAPQPPGGEPTGTGALPGAYDPTVAVPPVGPPDEPVDPYGPMDGDGDGDNRKWLWAGLAVLGVIVIGVVIALLLSDDGGGGTATTTSTSTSTSSSTSTSTSTTSTTVTTTPSSPQITTFNASPNPANCPNSSTTVQITLSWTTQNALGVSVSIDGPGKFADYGANGSAQVPFACSGSHSYTLTANGKNGQTTSQTITVQAAVAPPTTTTTAAPPPTTTTTAP